MHSAVSFLFLFLFFFPFFLHQGCAEDWWCLTLNRTRAVPRGRGPTRLVGLINEGHQLLIMHLARYSNPQRNRTISRTISRTGGFTSERAIYASGMITERDVRLYGDCATHPASANCECLTHISKRNVALIARIKKSWRVQKYVKVTMRAQKKQVCSGKVYFILS